MELTEGELEGMRRVEREDGLLLVVKEERRCAGRVAELVNAVQHLTVRYGRMFMAAVRNSESNSGHKQCIKSCVVCPSLYRVAAVESAVGEEL